MKLGRFLSLILLVGLGACHRKNSDGSPVGMGGLLPGQCNAYAPKTYSGPVVEGHCPGVPEWPQCSTRRQVVDVQANVIDYPYDNVTVKLMHPDGTFRTLGPEIVLGRGTVEIIDGLEHGFSSYEISEQLCR